MQYGYFQVLCAQIKMCIINFLLFCFGEKSMAVLLQARSFFEVLRWSIFWDNSVFGIVVPKRVPSFPVLPTSSNTFSTYFTPSSTRKSSVLAWEVMKFRFFFQIFFSNYFSSSSVLLTRNIDCHFVLKKTLCMFCFCLSRRLEAFDLNCLSTRDGADQGGCWTALATKRNN